MSRQNSTPARAAKKIKTKWRPMFDSTQLHSSLLSEIRDHSPHREKVKIT
jgi:hypothetical protein